MINPTSHEVTLNCDVHLQPSRVSMPPIGAPEPDLDSMLYCLEQSYFGTTFICAAQGEPFCPWSFVPTLDALEILHQPHGGVARPDQRKLLCQPTKVSP